MGTVLITGANGSLALPAVSYLLSRYPSCTAVLTVRDDSDRDPNTAKLRAIIANFPNANCSIRKLNLAPLSSIRAFTDEIHFDIAQGKMPPLVAIICNAFTWSLSSGPKFTEDGYEQSIAVNHLAHFTLTLRLLEDFDKKQGGRVLFFTSDSHWPGKAGFEKFPPILPEDLDLLEVGQGFKRYGLSKLVILMTMYELSRRLKKSKDMKQIAALAVDPGGLLDSRAFLGKDVPQGWAILIRIVNWLQPLLKLVKPTLRRASDGAEDIINLAVSPQYAGQECYFEMNQKAESSPDSKNERLQALLWDKSLEWCKLDQNDTVLPL
ncbi:short chain dehydrogenase/reductase SDR [Zopfia rhizophila CBS 207.26]|uniref:Short chain dehydrogenase/reductase SDR n=1 Tax=Zopfia rhizophila CBS 207.26 TaxID=1314779 RepID=A0A6A6ESV0_9PEZI|nr:short chain dehydrogenase/reductase SDR [Zopfia rhizophila CBS 207.26]